MATWPVAFTKNSRQRFYFRSVEATKDMSFLLFLPPLLLLLLLFFVFFCSILFLTDNDLTTIAKNMKVRFWTFSVTFSVTFSGIPKFARLKHGFWLLDMQVQRMTIMTPERTVSPVYTPALTDAFLCEGSQVLPLLCWTRDWRKPLPEGVRWVTATRAFRAMCGQTN